MKKIIVGILITATLAGCAFEPELSELAKNMVVQTIYDNEEINDDRNVFNEFDTYVFRLDTIGYITPFTNDTLLLDNTNQATDLPRADFVSELTTQINNRLTAKGYERVTEDEDPHFSVKVIVLEQFSFFQTVSYPGYYSGYYGYYGGYYGPVVNTYSSNYATLVVEVVDIKNYEENNFRYNVIWSAFMGDLLLTYDLTAQLQQAVDQAFAQSPYFSKE